MTLVGSQGGPREGSGAMFDAIAPRYDALNRILSLGIDQGWRRQAVDALELRHGDRVLDLATGTCDLAILTASRAAVSVVGLDPSGNMLAVGRRKTPRGAPIALVRGEAECLPFPDRHFDGLTMAFGIRNVVDRPKALREMARVTRLGGRIAILDLGEPRGQVLGRLARFHIHTVVPRVGALLSGASQYRYLQESITRFPPAAEFVEVMVAAGLNVLAANALTFGVCTLFVATPGGAR